MTAPSTSEHEMSLGVGLLNWPRGERVSDRYGLVRLLDEHDDVVLDVSGAPLGVVGALIARVVEQRPAAHIGDMFRGIGPDPAPAGTLLTLGRGELFVEADEYGPSLGVRPADGRASDWLDPHALYRVHNQRVELSFVPDAVEARS